jgi:hypothetical protein
VDNFAQPSNLGQFVPAGGINLTKIFVERAARPGVCGLGWWPVDLGQFVPAGGINLTKIGER